MRPRGSPVSVDSRRSCGVLLFAQIKSLIKNTMNAQEIIIGEYLGYTSEEQVLNITRKELDSLSREVAIAFLKYYRDQHPDVKNWDEGFIFDQGFLTTDSK
jgi:hypothetical protein